MIKPEFAFDIAFEIYQALKSEQEGIPILDAEGSGDGHWRPRNGAGSGEYIADFALAVRAPFSSPQDASRRILAELFYVALVPYKTARRRMGVSEYIWSAWADEVREKAGKEVMRRGLFPPKVYFGQRTRPRRAKQKPTPSSEAQAAVQR